MAVGNGKKRITFSLEAPGADEVFLCGTFNGWDPTKTPMKGDGKGLWKAIVMLHPGSYEYRMVVDGAWVSDPKAPSIPNEHGSTNSVREISVAA